MASGIVVHIPNLDRNILPFSPFDNDDFHNNLQKRITTAKRNQSQGKTSHKDNPNFHILFILAEEFRIYLLYEHGTDNYNTKALNFAGRIVNLVRYAGEVPFEAYVRALVRLQRALKKKPVSVMDAGVDQIIARVNWILTFEDPIRIWDYFALWQEDFGQQDHGEVPE